jgi:DNA-binding winged helix-turn-helix (wHTH) protein/TolB-like protein
MRCPGVLKTSQIDLPRNFKGTGKSKLSSLAENHLYQFSRFRLDPENHLLESEGDPVSLSPKAFEILLVLVQNGSGLTTKEELMRRVWPDSFVEEANLTVNISALRKQLGLTSSGQQHIETVPKKGYRFAVPVSLSTVDTSKSVQEAQVPASTMAPEILEEKPDANAGIENPQRVRNWRWLRVSFFAGVVVLFGLLALTYFSHRRKPSTSAVSQSPHRLAILPFQNLEENPTTDFLGFSLADAVITRLGYVSELSVRPSYAIQKYRNQALDIGRIAADLNVDTLLMGTFVREGDNLRIAYQLIDVKTENILWKGAYDLKYDKLLTVEDKVAEQIIRGLELTLSLSEAGRLKNEEAVSPQAYEYYLRGVDLYSKNQFPLAIKMLEKSTDLAPQFALSWANLGKAHTANASFHFGGGQEYTKAESAFARAIALQPDEIDARIFMANMFTDTGRVELAVPLLREALKKNPNHAEVHWELGYAYRFAGMLPEAVMESERAREIDPGVKLGSSSANAYLYLGRYDRFLESLPPGDDTALIVFYRGLGELYKKNLETAARNFDRAFTLDSSVLQAEIGRAFSLAIRHQNSQAGSILRAVEAKINQRGVIDAEATYKVAQAYVALGDKASALRVLSQSISNGFFPYPYFLSDPLLDPLRNEPDFQKVMITASTRHQEFKNKFFQANVLPTN